MLSFKMTSLQYFDNISFYISPKNKKMDISKIYTKWAVEKCPIWNFQTPRKPRNSKNKSGHCFAGHPVCGISMQNFLHQGIYLLVLLIVKALFQSLTEKKKNDPTKKKESPQKTVQTMNLESLSRASSYLNTGKNIQTPGLNQITSLIKWF